MDAKKVNLGLRAAVCALAMLFVAPTLPAQRPHSTAADSPAWNQAAKDRILDRMSKLILTSAYVPGVDFGKWDAVLAKIKPEAEKATSEEQFAGIVNVGLRNAFNISHIVLLPPRAVESRLTNTMVGIGIRIKVVDDGVLVTSTIPGAPAEKAGLEPGDVIEEADGHKVDGPTYIAGQQGTAVNLKVKKSDGSIKVYRVVREPFNMVQKEELSWVDKDTAVIKINTFDLSYDQDNVKDLMTKADKAKNLIVDLRNNGGGAVSNMRDFLSYLIEPGKEIGTFIDKRSVENFVAETKGDRNDLPAIAKFSPNKLRIPNTDAPLFKGKVAVLVNGGSGSASEITAEALKEILNAPVVGTPSAGAVLVSVMRDLPHNFNLQYPISDYISLKGVRLEAHGITPDAVSDDPLYLKKGQVDPAYTTAESLLNKIAKSGG